MRGVDPCGDIGPNGTAWKVAVEYGECISARSRSRANERAFSPDGAPCAVRAVGVCCVCQFLWHLQYLCGVVIGLFDFLFYSGPSQACYRPYMQYNMTALWSGL